MKNKALNAKYVITAVIVFAAVIVLAFFAFENRGEKNVTDNMSFVPRNENISVKIGDEPIENYSIAYAFGCRDSAEDLSSYIEKVTGKKLTVTRGKPNGKYILIEKSKEESEIEIKDGIITIKGNDSKDCQKQVNIFANTYLGYAFAGEAREHILENTEYINIPQNTYKCDAPWIPYREPIICLWKTDTARGIYTDQSVNLDSELMSYSDDMLYQYVKMMKFYGYNGIQVTDMCSAWAQYGNYEFVQQRLRFMADAAHSLGMDFTLWVWGAEFYGHRWVDKTVTYIDYDIPSREKQEIIDSFDKYYTIYAKLADCSDRVVMHFNDPGNLATSEDIAFFAKRFKTMCNEKNPDIVFGVSCYTYQIDLDKIYDELGSEVYIYSGVVHTDEDTNQYAELNNWTRMKDMGIAVWSWNLCEMEIDQIAEMNVNSHIIADSYRRTRNAVEDNNIEYWSEMDSYHIVNMFSLYCSGRLLQDPDLDEDVLLHESCAALVGDEYCDDLYECVSIIKDARSGSGWKEFKSSYDEYILLSDAYPAEELLKRCDAAIPKMEEMIDANLKNNTIPLPFSTSETLDMMLPHLYEIREYSQFRIDLKKAEEMAKDGADKEELSNFVEKIYTPVREYDTITGCWGQAEARAQFFLLDEFCKRNEIETPHDATFDRYRKDRILGEIEMKQKNSEVCLKFNPKSSFQMGIAFGEEETERLTLELVDEGLLVLDKEGTVYLPYWENSKFD